MKPDKRWFFIILGAIVAWPLLWRHLYFNPQVGLPRDNGMFHEPLFIYVVDYLRLAGEFPTWAFTRAGGVWLEPLANNLLILAPHRMIGYLLGWLLPIQALLAYKIGFLIVGQGTFLFFLFLLFKRLFNDINIALLGVLIALITFSGVGFLHQEHALGTVYFVPLIWILILKFKDSPKFLVPLAAVVGLSLNTHYPQLILTYLLLLSVCTLAFYWRTSWNFLQNFIKSNRNKALVLFSFLVLIISASPMLYSFATYSDKLKSPVRQQSGGIFTSSYEEYRAVCVIQNASVPLRDFAKYVGSARSFLILSHMDEYIVFLTPAFLLGLLVFLFFVPLPGKWFHVTFAVLLGLCAMGIYGPMASILWHVFFPIRMFRQWYHFTPLLNLHLLFILLVAVKWYWTAPAIETKWARRLVLACAGTLIGLVLFKQLRPGVGLLTVLLLGLKCSPRSRKVANVSLGLLLTVGSLVWGYKKLNLLTADAPPFSAAVPDRSGNRFSNMMTEKTWLGYLWGPLVLPKAVDEKFVKELHATKGFLLWREADEMTALNLEDFQIELGKSGLRIGLSKLPLGPTSKELVILQHNDGGWDIQNAAKEKIETLPEKNALLALDLKEGTNEIFIRRKSTPWSWLIWIHYMPLIFSGIFLWAMSNRFKR